MSFLRYDDPIIEKLKPTIKHWVQKLDDEETLYYVYVKDEKPYGMVVVRIEPMFFYAESGARFGEIVFFKGIGSKIDELLSASEELARKEHLAYRVISQKSFDEDERRFLRKWGYEPIDHAYGMAIDVEEYFDIPEGITLKPISISERMQFLEYEKQIYRGSGDKTTGLIMRNIRTLDDEELDEIYNEDNSYYVYADDKLIGLIVIFIHRGMIASIAVDPKHRNRGYGKKIMHFALNKLKENGWGRIYLRVHANNKAALKMYESMGFSITVEIQTYVKFSP